jgi:hypothetical protein
VDSFNFPVNSELKKTNIEIPGSNRSQSIPKTPSTNSLPTFPQLNNETPRALQYLPKPSMLLVSKVGNLSMLYKFNLL